MSLLEEHRPRFSPSEAELLARKLYRIETMARPLPSERDQNFHLTADSGSEYVLKISSSAERQEILEFQNRILSHLAEHMDSALFPEVRPSVAGERICRVASEAGELHSVRLLTYLSGKPLARVTPHSQDLLRELGRFMANLDIALQPFSHPVPERELQWDIDVAYEIIRNNKQYVTETMQRELVEHFLDLFGKECLPRLPELRCSIIHNDANDHNVLVAKDSHIAGIIDFGDMIHSYTAHELAATLAYAMLDKADPLAAGASVVGGYHELLPLVELEVELLYLLVCARLCVSVSLSAGRRHHATVSDYLTVSEQPAWRLLSQLAEIGQGLTHYSFRHACQMDPCPRRGAVVDWLGDHGHLVQPLLPYDLSQAAILDLSIETTLLQEIESLKDVQAFTDAVFRDISRFGARVGIGRYDEARLIYKGEAFRQPGNEGDEWRTIHLGQDLFAAAGTPVFAPLGGLLHSFADNAQPLDYGPTIILKHQTESCEFYTLYGHLSADALVGLRPGMQFLPGEQIGTVGNSQENGGWPPHVHFQIILDMLGNRGEFPGVSVASQRAVWLSICPDPNLILGIPSDLLKHDRMGWQEILSSRSQHLPPSLTLAYRKPLNIVRGWRQYLYDDVGRRYLDVVNNVAHVGHSHPRVVSALRRQAAILNTNTRYLHQTIVRYAKRICSTLPEPLSVCFFVCSGSEANELALRLARAHSGNHDILVVDGAYHGNTSSLIEISPYKFDGPGGRGAPPHVHKVPMPDPYRGLYRADSASAGENYARHVDQAIDAVHRSNRRVAAFICESAMGCGGQIILPNGYLREAFRYVRASGGVCIVDEVQVGFGRFGTHFWAFEDQGVVPDIVTMGKPMGNGHPLAAVVTTPEIAASFANGMEYFNTFGGNPVSCAVGMAVLDTIGDEQLQQNALRVGNRLISGLHRLKHRHDVIGDVRGRGLFVGVELVLDRETRTPATAAAAYVVERMRDLGILISSDGPDRNVLKIKPPLVFTAEDARLLIHTLDRILEEDFLPSD